MIYGTVKVAVMLMVFAGLVAAVDYAVRSGMRDRAAESVFTNTQPIVTELEKLAMLATLKVSVADILEDGHEDRFRRVKGAWLIKGDALICVDMAQAAFAVDVTNRHVAITLPQPSVTQARVDHTRTKTYNVERGWLTTARWESKVRDDAMLRAQGLVDCTAAASENINLAKERAAILLTAVCNLAGFSVDIAWISAIAPDSPTNAPVLIAHNTRSNL
jgi:hypothetical protein